MKKETIKQIKHYQAYQKELKKVAQENDNLHEVAKKYGFKIVMPL